jgi:hypothetical protein
VAAIVAAASAAAGQQAPPLVRVIGAPRWWIEPVEGNPSEGKLYYAALLENQTSQNLHVGVSFQSYTADGSRLDGCQGFGGEGSGVATEIAPHERALLTCNRSIVDREKTSGLQVTTRTWDVFVLRPASRVAAEAVATGIVPGTDYGYATDFQAFARVRSTRTEDLRVEVFFRFYAPDGTQVETCRSGEITVEPEVAVRASCWGSGVTVPNGAPRPTTVRAEIRPSD